MNFAAGVACLTLGLLAGACGGGSGSGGGTSSAAALPPNAVADANAKVPAELKDKLTFAEGVESDRSHKLLVVRPVGWEASKVIPGSYKPTDASGLGFMTSFSIGTNCDGTCEPKDWAATADKVEFKQLTSGERFKVEKDEKSPTSRLVVAAHADGSKVVTMAVWINGSIAYAYCRAQLEKAAAPAAAAFEQACRALTIVYF
jgi:hypothetical protein